MRLNKKQLREMVRRSVRAKLTESVDGGAMPSVQAMLQEHLAKLHEIMFDNMMREYQEELGEISEKLAKADAFINAEFPVKQFDFDCFRYSFTIIYYLDRDVFGDDEYDEVYDKLSSLDDRYIKLYIGDTEPTISVEVEFPELEMYDVNSYMQDWTYKHLPKV